MKISMLHGTINLMLDSLLSYKCLISIVYTQEQYLFEMSLSRKTNKILEIFQSVYVVLLIKQHTCKVTTLRLHIQKNYWAILIFQIKLNIPFYSVLACSLCFKLLEKVKKKVKFNLITNQYLFRTRSRIKDGESGISRIKSRTDARNSPNLIPERARNKSLLGAN